MAKDKPLHLLASSDGTAPSRWSETFPNAVICATDSLPAVRPQMVWLWLDLEADPGQIMPVLQQHFGREVPIAVMTRIPSAAEAVRCLQQGARAYLNAQAVPQVLKRVHDTVSSGAVWLGADLVEFLSAALHRVEPAELPESGPDWREVLTERETQVAELIGRGLNNKLVARQLAITERTVKAHLTSIFTKLDIQDRLALALLVSGRPAVALESQTA